MSTFIACMLLVGAIGGFILFVFIVFILFKKINKKNKNENEIQEKSVPKENAKPLERVKETRGEDNQESIGTLVIFDFFFKLYLDDLMDGIQNNTFAKVDDTIQKIINEHEKYVLFISKLSKDAKSNETSKKMIERIEETLESINEIFTMLMEAKKDTKTKESSTNKSNNKKLTVDELKVWYNEERKKIMRGISSDFTLEELNAYYMKRRKELDK